MPEERPVCPLCDSRGASPERQLSGYPIVRCSACGMVYVWPRPARDASRASYARSARGETGDTVSGHDPEALWYDYAAAYTPYVRQALARRLRRITRGHTVHRMLDFGCGSGHLLALAREVLRCDVAGLELDAVGRIGAARFGFALHAGGLEDAPFAAASFDLIYAGQVFEHLPEPRRELEMLCQYLSPGGIVYIEVPNYGSLSIRLRRDRFVNNRPPGHLNYFTPPTLRRLVQSVGLCVRSQRSTGLNHRALLGREKTEGVQDSCGTSARAQAAYPAPECGGEAAGRGGSWKLQLLDVLDRLLSLAGVGVQNEVVATWPEAVSSSA